jgi:hypothetical protein
MSIEDCATALVERGAAFDVGTTALPPPSMMQVVPGLQVPYLDRWVFTHQEYQLYEQQRDAFLRSPRGALALRSGGVLAYLAAKVLAPADCLQLPLALSDTGRISARPDPLTEAEAAIVCGRVSGRKMEEPVWFWPPQELFVQRFGAMYWSPVAQEYVEKREEQLLQDPRPATAKQWEKWMKRRNSNNMTTTLDNLDVNAHSYIR